VKQIAMLMLLSVTLAILGRIGSMSSTPGQTVVADDDGDNDDDSGSEADYSRA
jgi:hypothetical protein